MPDSHRVVPRVPRERPQACYRPPAGGLLTTFALVLVLVFLVRMTSHAVRWMMHAADVLWFYREAIAVTFYVALTLCLAPLVAVAVALCWTSGDRCQNRLEEDEWD